MNSQPRAFSIFCLVFVVTIAFCGATSAEETANPFRGKYRLTLKSGGGWTSASSMNFYLRSSGAAGKISGKGDFEYGAISFYLMQGSSSLGPDPLPIANLIVTYGSDEDTTELIVRLVKLRGWDSPAKITVMDAVTTFVDGPGGYEDHADATIKLERWDKAVKKWVVIK